MFPKNCICLGTWNLSPGTSPTPSYHSSTHPEPGELPASFFELDFGDIGRKRYQTDSKPTKSLYSSFPQTYPPEPLEPSQSQRIRASSLSLPHNDHDAFSPGFFSSVWDHPSQPSDNNSHFDSALPFPLPLARRDHRPRSITVSFPTPSDDIFPVLPFQRTISSMAVMNEHSANTTDHQSSWEQMVFLSFIIVDRTLSGNCQRCSLKAVPCSETVSFKSYALAGLYHSKPFS